MNLSRDKSMWRTRANKDLKKRKKKGKEEKKIGGDYDPLALKMKRVPRVVPPISFHLSRWTRLSSARGQHKFHRWNFHLIPFIWFSRKKWSGHCSPDPCLHPSPSPPPPIAETGVTPIPKNSRSFSPPRTREISHPTSETKTTKLSRGWFARTKFKLRGSHAGRAGWRGKRREEEFDDKVENLMDFTKAGGF